MADAQVVDLAREAMAFGVAEYDALAKAANSAADESNVKY